MASDLEAPVLRARIERIERWISALRWVVTIATAVLGFQMWHLIRPTLFQADTIRARNLTIVDERGDTVTVLSSENGVSGLSFYGSKHKSKAQIVVSDLDGPKILLFDTDGNQRALLQVADSTALVLHGPDHQVRALLTADNDATVFWVKDRKGFTTVLGNAVEETRKIDRSGSQPVASDNVKRTLGASIQLRDPGNGLLWKAP